MKGKTLITILWPVTVILALWFGAAMGVWFGTNVGRAVATNSFTWRLCSDLADIRRSCSDTNINAVLSDVQSLVLTVRHQDQYPTALQEFDRKIQELQNQPVEGTR